MNNNKTPEISNFEMYKSWDTKEAEYDYILEAFNSAGEVIETWHGDMEWAARTAKHYDIDFNSFGLFDD